ncbi:MAG: ABC transporter ATP-binding protein [Clostridiales bacterium]|nr:ABC transporter ATP-binding protein [Clostridiales bacterium]
MGYYFKTEKLTVGYDGKPLISDIDIGIEKGEILTLIGPNGSGKSTILKSITRHLESISGVVSIDGADMRRMSGRDVATRLSVVLTERINPELMSCGDIVATGRYPYTSHFGLLTAKDREIVRDSLEKVHATELYDRDFREISDGQRQRVMLARAICQEPEIIVLDEPTSFLDIRHKIELLNILSEMAKERGITVIMSLHEIDLAYKISDKIICVAGDKISDFGTPDEIFTEERIARLYGIENGSYDTLFGSVELQRPAGDPRVFVIGGAGSGIPFYRMLQRCGIPFAAGILYENDVDFRVARALAASVVSARAFEPVDAETQARAAGLLDQAAYAVDCGFPRGAYNRCNEALLSRAEAQGKPILRSAEEIRAAFGSGGNAGQ